MVPASELRSSKRTSSRIRRRAEQGEIRISISPPFPLSAVEPTGSGRKRGMRVASTGGKVKTKSGQGKMRRRKGSTAENRTHRGRHSAIESWREILESAWA